MPIKPRKDHVLEDVRRMVATEVVPGTGGARKPSPKQWPMSVTRVGPEDNVSDQEIFRPRNR